MGEFELLITLAAIGVLLSVVLVPYLFISHLGLKARFKKLERLVEQLQANRPAPEGLPQPAVEMPVQAEVARPDPTPSEEVQPAPHVFDPGLFDGLAVWLRENWVLAIAAASLALAGLFMVQYGVENGLLTPFWRVMGALGFGAALIAGGEFIRRRAGDEDADGDATGATRFLPSTLSGAGIIVLYVGVFSARALYGLIEPVTTLLGLAGVSVVALVLGWFYGPVLAAVGIFGATLAPFMTGSSSDSSWMVHYYLAMVAIVALGIDTIKRWAWVSILGLAVTLGGMAVLYAARGADLHFLAGVLITTFAAFAIPERGITPRQSGASMLEMLRSRGKILPAFPTRLTFGATLAAGFAALWVQADAGSADTVWLAILALALLLVATTIWTREAPALYDHALIPGMAFLAVIALEGIYYGALFRGFHATVLPVDGGPTSGPPATVWVLAAIGAAGSCLMFARMQWAVGARPAAASFWAFAAAVFAPATVLMLEFLWTPASLLGQYPWALAAIAMAALMVLFAARTALGDEGAPLRTGLLSVAALTLITLAFFLVLTKSALTVALAVTVLGTVLLDRRHALPPLSLFVQIAVAIITFRLVIWPGLDWAAHWDYAEQAYSTAYLEVAFSFLGPLALLGVAWWISRGRRLKTALVLESACWTILGVFLAITLLRAAPREASDSHWVMGLMSTIWVALTLNQLYRMRGGNRFMTLLRALVAGAYGLAALGTLAVLLTFSNPLRAYDEIIAGPPLFDSLALAFLPLAAVFAVAAWKITHFGRRLRIAFTLAASLCVAAYTGMEIRRLWRGRDLTVPGFTDAELYSYTLAMLIAAVALLMFAFAKRSVPLRKVAMAGVALTVAKVFLVDMSGLSGLIRVFSFMGLGLSLVALTWLNRKMTAQWDRKPPSES
ncbi:DUF2339 domain-containing protein [Pseudorhodobacter turbinis]|uniref:DUF2339 domain-containing protein n=1 Tax=Pseudorhodobacter turbinis TaxID=2500533 RepID=A0A4P8EH74_9RHOB|nr:DUF2339 domain-containing protein [Pseudorhodobacter turbinis]QCO56199.1 DUF2339 domain-containing protein [Pseudorhodobacter turbinis]